MEIRDLNEAQIRAAYGAHLMHDFPDDERKPLRMILSALANGSYRCLGMFDGQQLCAYAFLVSVRHDVQTDYLLDYFAVLSGLRGRGFGTQFLAGLKLEIPDASSLLIEIEDPADAAGEEQALRRRRAAFYFRCGCVDTGVRACVFGVRYILLELPMQSVHAKEKVQEIYLRLYRQVLQKEQYQNKIAFL